MALVALSSKLICCGICGCCGAALNMHMGYNISKTINHLESSQINVDKKENNQPMAKHHCFCMAWPVAAKASIIQKLL